MAIYHVCDVCGCEMPKAESHQCFVRIGVKKSYRDGDFDDSAIPHMDIDCCPTCAGRIYDHVKQMSKRDLRGDA